MLRPEPAGARQKKDDPSPASEPAPAPGSPSDHPAGTRQKGTDTNGQTTEKGPGTAGEKVEINWSGSWHKGTILETGNGKYKVRYDGWGSLYDEWISADRLRKLPWDRSLINSLPQRPDIIGTGYRLVPGQENGSV